MGFRTIGFDTISQEERHSMEIQGGKVPEGDQDGVGQRDGIKTKRIE